MRLNEVKEQIGRGEYHVDSHAVAEAIVRRLLRERRLAEAQFKRPQGECS